MAPSFLAFVQGKTVILIIHVNHIKFLVANTVALTTQELRSCRNWCLGIEKNELCVLSQLVAFQ